MRPTFAEPVSVAGRADRLRSHLDDRGAPRSMIIAAASNRRWLTGFTGSAGRVVVTPQRMFLVTDGRYGDQARQQADAAGAHDLEVLVGATLAEQRSLLVALLGDGAVAAEAAVMSHADWLSLGPELDLVAIDGAVESLRRVKDDAEIARIAAAADIASLALSEVGPMLVPGVTERDLRDELEYRMRRLGADGPSYETIVASGPEHAALPHARPTHRPFVEGDLVVIDVGALLDGYHSDMTRTYVVGDASPAQLEWFGLVKASQAAGLAAVRPGASLIDIDAACRSVFNDAGVGDLFVHGTGHGVGLDIHEDPFIGRAGRGELGVGDVVTVEPGLYRVGFGGIRIEDLVEVVDVGHRNFTALPKDDPCPPSPLTI